MDVNIKKILCQIFRVGDFQDFQINCLLKLIKNKDCFVCQPTGSGKSLIFQAFPFYKFLKENVSGMDYLSSSEYVLENCLFKILVVSPLTSLMQDQYQHLKSLGISVCCLNQDDEEDEDSDNISLDNNIMKSQLIYTSPESILSKFRYLMKNRKFTEHLVAIAIDESHCILKWGGKGDETIAFRTQYSQLSELRSLVIRKIPVISLTATATKETKLYIMDNLCMDNPYESIRTPEKSNIKFHVVKVEKRDPAKFLLPLIHNLKEHSYSAQKVLIFCRLTNDMNAIYKVFDKNFQHLYTDYKTRPYAMFFSETETIAKDHVLNEFPKAEGKVRILIATISFGMGVNCHNLYTVIHYGPPAGLDDYFQECGRAGRDGLQCNCVLVNYPKCLGHFIKQEVKDYVKNNEICRRKLILNKFGEASNFPIIPHDCCDICDVSCGCGCIAQVNNSIKVDWWRLTSMQDNLETNPTKELLSPDALVFLKSELINLRNKCLQNYPGYAGQDLLSGFPLVAIEQVCDISHKDITFEEIIDNTAILNSALIPQIIALVNTSCEKGTIESRNNQNSPDELSESDIEEDEDYITDFRVRLSDESDEE